MAFSWGSVDWGSVANAAVSLYGANQAAGAAKDAGKISAQGAEQSTALQRDIYNDQRNLNMPFYQGGLGAYNQYLSLMGLPQTQASQQGAQGQMTGPADMSFVTEGTGGVPEPNAQLYATNPQYRQAWDSALQQHRQQWKGKGYWHGSDNEWIRSKIASQLPANALQPAPQGQQQGTQTPAMSQQQAFAAFRNTPGYQFGLDEGRKTLEASASASGGLFSGKAGKALTQFGQNYADQQGYTPYMNRLAGLFGGAQTAGGQIGSAGQNFANQAGANAQNAANSRASGLLGSSQSKMWGLGQAGGFLNDAYGYYKQGGR